MPLTVRASAGKAGGRPGGGGAKAKRGGKKGGGAPPAHAPPRSTPARRPGGSATPHTASQAELLAGAAARTAAAAKSARAAAAARERAADEAAAVAAIAAVAAGRAAAAGGGGDAPPPGRAPPRPPSPPRPTPELTSEALLRHAGGPVPLPGAAPVDPLTGPLPPPGPRATRGRGARKGAERALLAAHHATLSAALHAELAVERAEATARLRDWPRARLAAAGAALFGLSARRAGALFGDALVRLSRPGGAPLPFHAFAPGDAVMMTQGGGGSGGGAAAAFPDLVDCAGAGVEGVLMDYSTTWLRVAVSPAAAARILGGAQGGRSPPSPSTTHASGGWRLDLHVSQTPHDRCVAALSDFCAPAPATRSPDDAACAGLRRALAAGAGGAATAAAAEAAAAALPPWATGAAAKTARKAAEADLRSAAGTGLNPSQAGAAAAALSRTLTLIQGPPGTGKTRTLAALLTAVVRHSVLRPPSRHAALPPPTPPALPPGASGVDQPSPPSSPPATRPVPILVAAASNVAVDNMILALTQAWASGGGGGGGGGGNGSPLRIVRLGPPAKASPPVRHLSLAALAAESPTGKAAAAARARAAGLAGPAARAERERAAQLTDAAAARVLGRAHVVAATCIGAGDPALDGLGFGLVALDEATQATEPAALVALLRRARAAVLVGDPAQLPPTVVSEEALAAGLGVSLFERSAAAGVRVCLLDTQYRMHPAIAAFPAGHFYAGRLVDGVAARDRPAPRAFPWPDARSPVAFVPVEGGREVRAGGVGFHAGTSSATLSVTDTDEDRGGGRRGGSAGEVGGSYANPAEAAALVAAARLLVGGGGATSSAGGDGHARPHAHAHAHDHDDNHHQLLAPESVGVITPYAGQARALRLALDAAGLGGVEVRTVDGFQGREKEVILFSAVRSNPARRVGFLADGRRLNVALTRARRGLVVVGARHTLAADGHWRAWLAWVDGRGLAVRRGDERAAGIWEAVDAAVAAAGSSSATARA